MRNAVRGFVLLLLAVCLGGIAWLAWDRGVGPFQPRYGGRPIGLWFPRWWTPGQPPSTAATATVPAGVGPEAVPFLVRELGRGEATEHRLHRWLASRLPVSLAGRLPQPYPGIALVPGLTRWLQAIAEQPGGPAALARAVKDAAPFARRRLLIHLGDVRSDLPEVVTVLHHALADTDPEIRRAAGRALLRLDPAAAAPAIPDLLAILAAEDAPQGLSDWRPLLHRLELHPQHAAAITTALARWSRDGVPEALATVAALQTNAHAPPRAPPAEP